LKRSTGKRRVGGLHAALLGLLACGLVGCGGSSSSSGQGEGHSEEALTPIQRDVRVATWLNVARIRINGFLGGEVINPDNGRPRLVEAIEVIEEKVLRMDPENYAGHMCLGEARALSRQFPEAEDAFQRAVKLASAAAAGRWKGVPPEEVDRRIADAKFRLVLALWEHSGSVRDANDSKHIRRQAIDTADEVFRQHPLHRQAALWLAEVKLGDAVSDPGACAIHVDKALVRFPNDPDLLDLGARAAVKNKDWGKAVTFRSDLAEQEPKSVARWLALADVCLSAIPPAAAQVGQPRDWAEHFLKAREKVDALGAPADRSEMEAKLQRLLDLCPWAASLAGTRPGEPGAPGPGTETVVPAAADRVAEAKAAVRSLLAGGDLDEAFRAAEELATRLAAEDPESHAMAAETALALGRTQEAAGFARDGLALDGSNAPLHVLLGRCAAAERRWDAAAEHFRAAGQVSSEAREALAAALEKGGKPAEATAELAALVAAEPDNLQARYRLACLCSDIGRFREGAEHWQYLVLHHQSLVPARLGLADALVNALFMREAMPHLRFVTGVAAAEATMLKAVAAGVGLPETVEVVPADAAALDRGRLEAFLQLALCLQWEQKPTDAVQAYYDALKLEPEDTRAHNGLGRLYLDIYTTLPRQGAMRDRAMEQFGLSLRKDPNQPDIRAMLEQLGG
jgi:tetratricopeptide (TPR) repeat protein